MPLIEAYADRLRREEHKLQLVVVENPPTKLSEAEQQIAVSLRTSPKKRKKTYFMQLSEGSFLVSNVISGSRFPVFAEYVVATDLREQQWAKIRSTGAAQGLCRVFLGEAYYLRWSTQVNAYFSSRRGD